MTLRAQVDRLLADESSFPGSHDAWTVRLAQDWQRLDAALREIERNPHFALDYPRHVARNARGGA